MQAIEVDTCHWSLIVLILYNPNLDTIQIALAEFKDSLSK